MTDAAAAGDAGVALEALGDPTRRRILELLADGEQSVATLVATLATTRPMSQPAVSQHLRRLLAAHLVQVRAEGRTRRYTLDPAGITAAAGWLEGLLVGPFTQPLDALATEVARGHRQRRRDDRSVPDADADVG